ncbi:hypothetical protein [Terriglobus saanensis]|uniref:Uncharacterized protein n=1 Tax=Terriglobus saanensis (strain ATCC BAA-1853 / DSM 23119 / SP1PR4) TaxID=401053 RepID=E8V887_TERSS|nr:hypothetical protein [Terriglobus saanensis]ADV81790.1 hypothetical protein AciPR4_0957 [Terriglobus saanensis SP1PR4]
MSTQALPSITPVLVQRLLWVGHFRLYLNSLREAPLVWSIDDGDPAHEVKCTCIHMNNVPAVTGCSVKPGYTPQPEDQRVAKAWVEGEARVVQLHDGEISLEPLDQFSA